MHKVYREKEKRMLAKSMGGQVLNKIKKIRQNSPGLFWLLVCYGCGVLLLLGSQLAGLAANKIGYATGSLVAMELAIDDFDLVDLERNGDELLTIGADPQMIYKQSEQKVENLIVEAEYRIIPREQNAFWAKIGQEHSIEQMVFATGKDGTLYLLPAAGGQQMRFDPDTRLGNTISVHRIAINQPRPFWAFFIPTARQLILLITIPGLVASLFAIVRRADFSALKKRKGGEGV